MRIQLLSDLHLETETFDPEPAPGADLLVLAGDIDTTWHGLRRFAGWPVPVLVVAGNHEFDGRELNDAWPALREHCGALGLTLLEREAWWYDEPDGRRVRVLGTVRWCDFDLFGPARREKCMRAGTYFSRVMRATWGGQPFEPKAVRAAAMECREWLHAALDEGGSDCRTVVVTHFGPSRRSLDPRYGAQPTSASFCNADDDLLARADLWLHGHLHWRHDYTVVQSSGRRTRVVCQARGLAHKGEIEGFVPELLIEI